MDVVAPPLRITYAGATSRPDRLDVVADPAHEWVFGRSSRCDLQLTSDDLGVSRNAGRIHFDRVWMLTTPSASRACYLERTGRPRLAVTPGEPVVLNGPASIVVAGDVFTYRIDIHLPEQDLDQIAPDDTSEASTFVPRLSDAEQWAVAAIAWGYLQDGAHHDPNPLTYDEAAALLDLTGDTVRKRAENLRRRLANVGIPGVDARDARRAVVEFCLTHRLIGQATLDAVRGRRR